LGGVGLFCTEHNQASTLKAGQHNGMSKAANDSQGISIFPFPENCAREI